MSKTTEERFWQKVNKEGPVPDGHQELGRCWVWIGSKRSKGYGAFVYARDGEVVQGRAHRYSYELHRGAIPSGVFVLHKCDTPACVNPDHLFLGSNADNVTDMMAKGRHVKGGTYRRGNYERGAGHHNARLTVDIVRAIRADREAGLSFGNLATKYGLVVGYVYRIIKRTAWREVE